MLVFITGAAGFIGQAVVSDLISHGHQALGLARSDASAEKITKLGGQVHRGNLEDLESLKSGAKAADGVIHLAFNLDFSEEAFKKALKTDRDAIQAMAEAMEGTGKPLVIASGALLVAGVGETATEDTPIHAEPNNAFKERRRAEILVEELSKEKNIRGSVIRLAPIVHGPNDKAFVPMLAGAAQKNGFVTSVGDGSTRWSAVHLNDAVTLFRLALEKGRPGALYHGTAEDMTTGRIMEEIGKKLSLPVENKPADKAMELIDFLAILLGFDCPISSEKTQKELGWNPSHPDLVTDIRQNYKF